MIQTGCSLDNVLATIRTFADDQEKLGLYDCRNFGTDSLRAVADIAEESLKRSSHDIKDVVEAVAELCDGMCMHCDMQDRCAEGEDGMPTMCNAMTRVKNFLENYGPHKETIDGLPF